LEADQQLSVRINLKDIFSNMFSSITGASVYVSNNHYETHFRQNLVIYVFSCYSFLGCDRVCFGETSCPKSSILKMGAIGASVLLVTNYVGASKILPKGSQAESLLAQLH
jgi:hypothetical protein